MVKEIEIFSVEENKSEIVKLENSSKSLQLEILSSVQIDQKRILIFGGVNYYIKDSRKCFVMNTENNALESKSSLIVPQVYTNSPIVYNNQVYVIGNEYYAKRRRIQIYDIEKDKWRLLY